MNQNETQFPEGWDRVELAVNPETGDHFILKCRQKEGGGDQPYPAVDALKKKMSQETVNEIRCALNEVMIKQGLNL